VITALTPPCIDDVTLVEADTGTGRGDATVDTAVEVLVDDTARVTTTGGCRVLVVGGVKDTGATAGGILAAETLGAASGSVAVYGPDGVPPSPGGGIIGCNCGCCVKWPFGTP
jgi:hypothetical protein